MVNMTSNTSTQKNSIHLPVFLHLVAPARKCEMRCAPDPSPSPVVQVRMHASFHWFRFACARLVPLVQATCAHLVPLVQTVCNRLVPRVLVVCIRLIPLFLSSLSRCPPCLRSMAIRHLFRCRQTSFALSRVSGWQTSTIPRKVPIVGHLSSPVAHWRTSMPPVALWLLQWLFGAPRQILWLPRAPHWTLWFQRTCL